MRMAARSYRLLRQPHGFEGSVMILESIHSDDLSVPERPQVGEGTTHLDLITGFPVEVAERQDLVAEVDEPLHLQRSAPPKAR